ncbi:nucleoporin Nup43-like [Mya arenaria]|uniref:nucleoporin Nup43-like n=1 Tax=Mya arenaria TaxID=6604 RepID=UPI0022E6453D|nr:nucleoporin Nup43-like [Mya arenaria]
MADIRVKFVSQKISKVRFRPAQGIYSQGSDVFASGNWDDESGRVCLWQIPLAQRDNGDMEGGDTATDREPTQLCETSHRGDVTDMEFLGTEAVAVSSSLGTVTVYRHRGLKSLEEASHWSGIHSGLGHVSCACTCVATQGEDLLVSAGEDGRINVLNISHRTPIRTIKKANSCTINGVRFLKQLEVITVDSSGQLKIFDLRQNSEEPSKTFTVSGEQTPLQSIARHPTQQHVVATGGHDGVLSIWDLRQEKFPVTLLEAHSAPMWEVKFHPTNPEHLFTCSEDGSVWHWDSSAVTSLVTGTGAGSGGGSLFAQPPGGAQQPQITSPWLGLESGRSKMEISTLLPNQSLPINTLDIDGETLICGSDEEAIYTIDIPGIR